MFSIFSLKHRHVAHSSVSNLVKRKRETGGCVRRNFQKGVRGKLADGSRNLSTRLLDSAMYISVIDTEISEIMVYITKWNSAALWY